MAFGTTSNQGNKVYFNCANGSFVRKMAEPTELSRTRVNKEGNTVHEELYSYVDGLIVDAKFETKDFQGKPSTSFIVEVADPDGGPSVVIAMRDNSAYTSSLIGRLAKIPDFTKPVRLFIWSMENKTHPDRPFTGISVYTKPGDKSSKLPSALATETAAEKLTPEERALVTIMPDVELIDINDVITPVKTKQIKFLKTFFADNIEQLIKRAKLFNAISTSNPSIPAPAGDAMEDPDELPF